MKQFNRKLWVFLLALLALAVLCVFSASAQTVTGDCGTNAVWSYDTESKTLTISGEGEVTSGSGFEEYKNEIETVVVQTGITRLSSNVFNGFSALTSVSLPVGLTSIGSSAFSNCTALESITLPDGLEHIDWSAFTYCPLLLHISIPASLSSYNGAFMTSFGLASIDFSEGLTQIGMMSFLGCMPEELVIPNSVRDIKSFAFGYCPYLKTVHLGTNIERIGYGAFNVKSNENELANNDSLELIYTCMTEEEWAMVQTNVAFGDTDEDDFLGYTQYPNYKPDGVEVVTNAHIPDETGLTCSLCGREIPFGNCGAGENGENLIWEYEPETKTLIISGAGEMADYDHMTNNRAPWYSLRNVIEAVQIEEGVTSVGNAAFYNCSRLSSVTLPESLTRLGEYAFLGCGALTDIAIPKNVTTAFQPFAFSGLTAVTMEDGLQKIDKGMFVLTALQSVVIPDSVETIGSMAFAGCTDLTTVRLGMGVQSIGYAAFEGLENPLGDGTDFPNSSLADIRICKSVTEWAAVATNVVNTDDPVETEIVSQFPNKAYKPAETELVLNAHVVDRTQEITVPASCTAAGHIDTVSYCALCDGVIGKISVETDPELGHNCGALSWEWSDDGTMAIAQRTCARCEEIFIKRAAVTREAQDDETILCTATVTFDGQSYSETKTVQSGETVYVPIPTPTPTPSKPSTFRCSMCKTYEAYKGKGFIGALVSIVHTFVHFAQSIGR